MVYYHITRDSQPVTIEFLAPDGGVIKLYENDGKPVPAPTPGQGGSGGGFGGGAAARPGNALGLNSFNWNLRYPDAVGFPGMIMWAGGLTGPVAPAGTYSVRVTVGTEAPQTARFNLLNDPRSDATAADLQAQFDFLIQVRDKTSEANNAVRTIRNIRAQIEERVNAAPRLRRNADALLRQMAAIEEEVYQVRNQSGQDPLNYPIRINNKIAALSGVAGSGPFGPTDQTVAVYTEVSAMLKVQTDRLDKVLREDLERFNRQVRAAGQQPIVPSTDLPTPAPTPVADDDDMFGAEQPTA